MSEQLTTPNNDWFLGLDIGTDSVGWAVTDTEYRVKKINGNATWGIYLFDAAKTAAERRTNRAARRRLDRKKQRIAFLQDFMSNDIAKVDDKFFIRIKESALWADDRSTGTVGLFVGNDLTDKIYNSKYPTIHHLICELMDNPESHDPRLVYMACSYILSHRGHFLIEVDSDNLDKVTDFSSIYDDYLSWFDTNDIERPWNASSSDFGSVLKQKKSIGAKESAFYDLLFNGVKPSKEDEDSRLSIKLAIGLLCGRKIKLSDLFCNEEYKNLEDESICISSVDFDDKLEVLSSSIDDADYDYLVKSKKMYDWSLLVDILQGEQYISRAKVKTYEKHQHDLKSLKYLTKKYLPNRYEVMFRSIGKDPNYASYSYNAKNNGKKVLPKEFKMCSQEDFCKFVLNYISSVEADIEPDDVDLYNYIKNEAVMSTLCPKQMTSDNRVIPYQLYYAELKKILHNAKAYMPTLCVQDEYGSVEDKILSLMKFRIPYYVGPLNSSSKFAWIKRKGEGKITPWNFDDIVDKEESENAFIRRMTAKCTYLPGEDVLPKNSLLYSKFVVLNEINNIRVSDVRIDSIVKQRIYEELFMKKRVVKVKDIEVFLKANGFMSDEDILSGIDISIKSSLKSYHDFMRFLMSGQLNERQVEEIIYRITLTTDRNRLRNWLSETFDLSSDDIKYISKLKYSDFGRISERLLTQVYDLDLETGVIRSEESIIEKMWNTNSNFMELLSSGYGYSDNIKKISNEYYDEHHKTLDEKLEDMYISNSVKRPILRTMDIVNELNKVMKCAPKKIFIEMARGASEKQKNKRTASRRDQIRELYKKYDKAEVAKLLSELDSKTDDQLRSESLFLYFTQLGRCMYSGQPINISEIGTRTYDIDHIWPQSKIKDDSIDNKVLVLSKYNGTKGDKYPLPEEWREKQYSFWENLHSKELISDKKFDRLKRHTRFTDEELASFINRQLVETRQSTKAIANILKDKMPNTDIVYVKAGLVSDFRRTYKDNYFTLKCREVNDFHHAKDAYLNIVMGNIYDTYFTKNPLSFVEAGNPYTLNTNSILNHDVIRNGIVAWRSEDDIWFNRVVDTIHKNNIRFVRYSFKQTGALFDLQPVRKGLGQVERKQGLKLEKYGGYNKQSIAGFYLVKHDSKKSRVVSLVPVSLMKLNGLQTIEQIRDYCEKDGYKNVEVLLNGRIIKTNTLIEVDGYRVHLSGKSGDSIWFKGAQQLILGYKLEAYVKKLVNYYEKSANSKTMVEITQFDGITREENIRLYAELKRKITQTKYRTFMDNAAKVIDDAEGKFSSLSVEQQSNVLVHMIELFGCNNSHGKDLTGIGGVKSSGIQTMSLTLNSKKFKCIQIVDQSPTGLFESKTPNLLDL